jgi:hypothetical protein
MSELREWLRRHERRRTDHVAEQHRDLATLGLSRGLHGRFLLRTCRFGRASGDGLQEPPAIAQGKAELFEIALAEFRQDIHADVVRFERVGVVLEIVACRPPGPRRSPSGSRRSHPSTNW